MGYESSAERWSPVQSVEKILLSVVSMLAGTCFTGQTPPGGQRWNRSETLQTLERCRRRLM